ncbi:MAG: hypothetical protein KDD52_03910 [Bdellovibrionales bacterium]|nr:hypothetical protein [Bdellovibrionales bacterium]
MQELSIQALLYTGDQSRSSTGASFQYAFHFNRTLWMGIDAFWNPLRYDSKNSGGSEQRQSLWALSPILYFNMPSLLNPQNAMNADFYTSLGVGGLMFDSNTKAYATLGGGLILYPWNTQHFALRFDFKTLIYRISNPYGGDWMFDVALGLGPSFLL